MVLFIEGVSKLERLNLSNGKKRVIKLKTFIIILLFVTLPALSLIYLSYQMKILETGKLLRNYPVVFNNLSSLDMKNLDQQIDNLKYTFEKRVEEIRNANIVVKNSILNSYKDIYFLKYFSYFASRIPNRIFLKEIRYDGVKFFIDFYEYSIETKVSTQTVYSDLSKLYKNVLINKIDEKNFFGNMRYFRYNMEGEK